MYYGSFFHVDQCRLVQLSRSQILVYTALISHGGKSRTFTGSQSKLATIAGISLGSVKRALKHFEEQGWLSSSEYYQVKKYTLNRPDIDQSLEPSLDQSLDLPSKDTVDHSYDLPLDQSLDLPLDQSLDPHVKKNNKEEQNSFHDMTPTTSESKIFFHFVERWSKLKGWKKDLQQADFEDLVQSAVNFDFCLEIKVIDSWLLKPALAVNYIYLSDEESKLLKNFEHRYLIERVSKSEFLGNINESTLSVELFNPTKEMYIVPRRDDLININQHSNYTNFDCLDDVDFLGYQNYLYKLCFDYYNKIIQKHRELSRLYSEMLNSTLPLIDNLNGQTKNYYNIEPLPQNISPLYFYGLFRTNNAKTIDPVISTNDNIFTFKIKGTNLRYPVINKTLEEYIITNQTHQDIELLGNININKIKANEAPNNDDIVKLINNWQFRDIKDIPAINNDNYKYFDENIVKSLEIKLNGDVRLGAREYNYYNKIQPYNYHTGSLPRGVLLYSFSINPEDFQPSGACNFSNFESIELLFRLKSPFENESLDKKNIKYDIKLYTTAYNILKIENGECQLLFKT